MLDFVKRTYLMGLGLATLTREKVEEVVDELVRRGEIAEKDRHSVMNDLMKRVKDEQKRLSQTIRENVERVISEMGVPSRSQYEELVKRVENLERTAHAHQEESGTRDVSTPEGS